FGLTIDFRPATWSKRRDLRQSPYRPHLGKKCWYLRFLSLLVGKDAFGRDQRCLQLRSLRKHQCLLFMDAIDPICGGKCRERARSANILFTTFFLPPPVECNCFFVCVKIRVPSRKFLNNRLGKFNREPRIGVSERNSYNIRQGFVLDGQILFGQSVCVIFGRQGSVRLVVGIEPRGPDDTYSLAHDVLALEQVHVGPHALLRSRRGSVHPIQPRLHGNDRAHFVDAWCHQPIASGGRYDDTKVAEIGGEPPPPKPSCSHSQYLSDASASSN